MRFKIAYLLLIALFFSSAAFSQDSTYTVAKTTFSTNRQDEFAPLWYNGGLVFCTNESSGLAGYSASDNTKMFNLFFVERSNSGRWMKPRSFSNDLKTRLNDGPATFNTAGDTIYYSRNLMTDDKLKALSSIRNKLGIFSAVYNEGEWTQIRELRYNNEWYNLTTPSLSPDSKRLYFASDMPDGYGGSDIYYCEWKDGYWDNPVNLGPVINTEGNESYPFTNTNGELFFSSDGHKGLGRKDIFYSEFRDSTWLPPVPLDPPVNSEWDDFGLITDELMEEGYFSSNRDAKSLDIFYFKTNHQQQFYSETQIENQYCLLFEDDKTLEIMPDFLKFEWDFGDDAKAEGEKCEHCYAGPGKYFVQEKIADRTTGKAFFTKTSFKIEISDIEQPYINSTDAALVGDSVKFDGLRSKFMGYSIIKFDWDFGDHHRLSGNSVAHEYSSPGEYNVKLGLIIRNNINGDIRRESVQKKISIFLKPDELTEYARRSGSRTQIVPDIFSSENARVSIEYSAIEDLRDGAVFLLEVMNSPRRISKDTSYLEPLLKKYFIKEIADPDEGVFHYIIDEEQHFSDIFFLYRDVVNMGYNNAKVLLYIFSNPAEKELAMLKEIYGTSTDVLFIKNNYRISSLGIAFLDQVALLMKKNPNVKLFIGTHSDNSGSPNDNLVLSGQRSRAMANYLIEKGINKNNIVYNGFGSLRPVALNNSETNRKKNRRVEFIVVNQ